MMSGPVAIVGSTRRGDADSQARVKRAVFHLGRALARKKFRILVYSDDEAFIEFETVRGYLDSGAAAEGSIEVRYPERKDEHGQPIPPPFHAHFNDARFRFIADSRADWEVSYYTSFEDIGGMLIVQGGRSALVSGLVAIGYRKPVAPCGGFGGTATGLVSMFAERDLVLNDEKALLQEAPDEANVERWAGLVVALLETQAARLAQKKADELLAQRVYRRAMSRHVAAAVAALILAVALWLCNLDNRMGLAPEGVLAFLFACSGLAGVTGAMLWVILPYLRGKVSETVGGVWSSVALGVLAGGIACLLFLIGEEHGFPDLSSHIQGAGSDKIIEAIRSGFFAQLIPASMLSSLAAGVTLDRALATMTSGHAKAAE
jgi:hypothetical protein